MTRAILKHGKILFTTEGGSTVPLTRADAEKALADCRSRLPKIRSEAARASMIETIAEADLLKQFCCALVDVAVGLVDLAHLAFCQFGRWSRCRCWRSSHNWPDRTRTDRRSRRRVESASCRPRPGAATAWRR